MQRQKSRRKLVRQNTARRKPPRPKTKRQNPQSKRRKRNNGFSAPAIGRAVGSLFGGPFGSAIGTQAGHLFRTVTGVGDYSVSGNSLMNSIDRLPSFKNTSTGTRIQHREYIGDIYASDNIGAFSIQAFPIQPALPRTFPWLAAIAENYQEYQLHGLIFEFKTMSYDAISSSVPSAGTVIMATNYNVLDPAFTNKIQMEQNQFTCSGKPSRDLLHPIECLKPVTPTSTLYTRAVNQASGDLRLFDWGTFFIATQGCQAATANLGELWVTYDMSLFKPKLGPTVDVFDHYIFNGVADTVQPGSSYFGLTTTDIPRSIQPSDMGTIIRSSDGTNYNRIVWPPGYRGNVMIVYTLSVGNGTFTAYKDHIVLNLRGCTSIDWFGLNNVPHNQSVAYAMTSTVNQGVTLIWCVQFGGSVQAADVTFTGGSDISGGGTPIGADLHLLALPAFLDVPGINPAPSSFLTPHLDALLPTPIHETKHAEFKGESKLRTFSGKNNMDWESVEVNYSTPSFDAHFPLPKPRLVPKSSSQK